MPTRPGEVTPILKEGSKPWVCKFESPACERTKPCVRCRGARNRRSGMRKQREARKSLEAITGKQAGRFSSLTGNEESWRLPLRVEVKSGLIAQPVWTKYAASEAQSNAAKPTGDARPFAAVFMGTRTSDGLFVCRLSKLGEVVSALLEIS